MIDTVIFLVAFVVYFALLFGFFKKYEETGKIRAYVFFLAWMVAGLFGLVFLKHYLFIYSNH